METRTTSPRFPHLNRRQFLQIAAAAGTLTGAGALLDACGSGGSTGPSGPATITVMYGQGELIPPGYKGTDPVYVNDFNNLHKGSITAKFIASDATRLTAMIAAGTPPDFFRVAGGPDIINLMLKGVAANLQTHFAKSSVIKESDLVSVNDYYRWDGHTAGQGDRYGMAKDWSQDAMIWYNTDLFKKKGIPNLDPSTPVSWEDLTNMAKELTVTTNGKVSTYGMNSVWSWSPEICVMQWLAQNNQELYSNNLTHVNIYDQTNDKPNPLVYDAFNWLVQWTQAKVGPSVLLPETTGDTTLFQAGREAISGWGYWYGGALYVNGQLPSYAAFAPAPQDGPKLFNACFYGVGGTIASKSKNIDAAFTFLEYFLGGGGPAGADPAHGRASSGFGLPALQSLWSLLPQGTPAEKAAFQVQTTALTHNGVLHFSPYDTGFGPAFSQYMPDVFLGKADLKKALKNIDAAVNSVISSQIA